MKLDEQVKVLEFKDFGDERGDLVVVEGSGMDVPFVIQRIFYIYLFKRGPSLGREMFHQASVWE